LLAGLMTEPVKALVFAQRAYPQTLTVGNIFLRFESAAARK
jgi:hypothetical protein